MSDNTTSSSSSAETAVIKDASTSNTLWGGRFSETTDEFVQAFTASVNFDRRMYRQDIEGSKAHATMLMKSGVLTEEDCNAIHEGLADIEKEIGSGQFQWSVALEDVHMNIEAALTKKIGDAGKRLHTGRSRNDQVATDIRLYMRDACDVAASEYKRLLEGLLSLAEANTETIMPGFTHLQTAQPVTFGHHVMAWFEMLLRDLDRLSDTRSRLNSMPLGAAALAGTSYPIQREVTQELLGFLWMSAQFRFIDLPDRFCTGSSIMPQKKNPDVPELVRGKTGRAYGNLMSLLTLMKSQPLAYNKDNQEDKEPLFDSVDTLLGCLRAFADMLPAVSVRKPEMLAAAKAGFSTATDLADYLVRKGIAFRDAHEVVGSAVAYGVEHNLDLADMPLEVLQSFSKDITEDVFEVLTLDGSVSARSHVGGTAPSAVKSAIGRGRQRLAGLC